MAKSTGQAAITAGDAAVDGLIFGAVAGAAMGLYLIGAGLTWGESAPSLLARFDPGASASPVVGLFTHLALSAVYGVLFALGWRSVARWVRAPAWAGAAAYGLLLWALAATVFLSNSSSGLRALPPFHFAVAHFLYGLALGFGLGRRK